MMNKIIFFGNGLLADIALDVIKNCSDVEIIFHARTKKDLEEVKRIKLETPEARGVLASFGVLIKKDVLDLFEPEGILNIHPSKLPEYRGASPIETAILDGRKDFSVSVMKLVSKMDAGPVYYQKTIFGLPLDKREIYRALAEAGAGFIVKNLDDLPKPFIQDESKATYTRKFEKMDGFLNPKDETVEEVSRKIVAFQDFPKPKMEFFGKMCIILEARILSTDENAAKNHNSLVVECGDGRRLEILRLQPESRKPMNAEAFLNGIKNL